MVSIRGWRKGALSAALAAAMAVSVVPSGYAWQGSFRAPARLSLPVVLSKLAGWLGLGEPASQRKAKACKASEDTLHIDPNGCPATGETPQTVTEDTLHIDPNG